MRGLRNGGPPRGSWRRRWYLWWDRDPYVLVTTVEPFADRDLVAAMEQSGLHPVASERSGAWGARIIDRVEIWVRQSEVAAAMRLLWQLGLTEGPAGREAPDGA